MTRRPEGPFAVSLSYEFYCFVVVVFDLLLYCWTNKLLLILICKFDKGNGMAVLDSSDYHAKLQKIIQDKSKFVEVKQDTDIHAIIQ